MQFPTLFFMVNNWELIEKGGRAALQAESAEPNGASEEMVLHSVVGGCFIRCLHVVINSMWQFYYWTNGASDKQDRACKAMANGAKGRLRSEFPRVYTG